MHFTFSCYIFQTANKYRTTITWRSQIFFPSSTILSDKLQQIASLTKQHFKLYCQIYYKILGSLHFGILYNWFWQWLTWFGLLLFHPREIKHRNLCRCVMGQGFTICSAKSDFKDFKNKNPKAGIASVIIQSFLHISRNSTFSVLISTVIQLALFFSLWEFNQSCDKFTISFECHKPNSITTNSFETNVND